MNRKEMLDCLEPVTEVNYIRYVNTDTGEVKLTSLERNNGEMKVMTNNITEVLVEAIERDAKELKEMSSFKEMCETFVIQSDIEGLEAHFNKLIEKKIRHVTSRLMEIGLNSSKVTIKLKDSSDPYPSIFACEYHSLNGFLNAVDEELYDKIHRALFKKENVKTFVYKKIIPSLGDIGLKYEVAGSDIATNTFGVPDSELGEYVHAKAYEIIEDIVAKPFEHFDYFC